MDVFVKRAPRYEIVIASPNVRVTIGLVGRIVCRHPCGVARVNFPPFGEVDVPEDCLAATADQPHAALERALCEKETGVLRDPIKIDIGNRNISDIWQIAVNRWGDYVFGPRKEEHGAHVYSLRLLEEALELAQAEGATIAEVQHIVSQVLSKEPGEPKKELGGVLICVSGYANAAEFNLGEVFEFEYARIQDPAHIERIRYRNFHGDKIGLRPQDVET